MKSITALIIMVSLTGALMSTTAYGAASPAVRQPIMLSRLPYDIGPVRSVPPPSLDDYENIQINTDSTIYLQNEEQVAINPLATNHLVAMWRDFRFGYRRIGYGVDIGFWSDLGRSGISSVFLPLAKRPRNHRESRRPFLCHYGFL